jgi:multidrug efflux system outer membrane protein
MAVRVGLLLGLLLPLGGCMIVKHSRPPVPVPERYLAAAPGSAAGDRWWQQFRDPVLDEAIQAALKDSLDLRIATLRLREYQAYLSAAGAPLWPDVALAGSDTVSGGAGVATRHSRQAGLTVVNWELDLWGRIGNLSAAAAADLQEQAYARQGLVLSLVAAVTTSYIQLRELDARLESARLTLDARAESQRLAQLRYQVGLISELELKQAGAEYQGTVLSVQQLEQAVAMKEHGFSLLLGRNPGPIQRGLAIEALAAPVIPAGLPSDLLNRRPDLLQAEQSLAAAEARVGAARASLFPTISLTGNAGYLSPQLAGLFSGPNRVWTFIPGISLPIFNAGGLRAQLRASRARREQALAGYEKAVQAAFRETEDALVSVAKLNEQLATQGRLVEELRRYAFLARLRYENGVTSNLEVLDSQRNLFAAEQGLAQVRSAALVATVDLYKALGGDWEVQNLPDRAVAVGRERR